MSRYTGYAIDMRRWLEHGAPPARNKKISYSSIEIRCKCLSTAVLRFSIPRTTERIWLTFFYLVAIDLRSMGLLIFHFWPFYRLQAIVLANSHRCEREKDWEKTKIKGKVSMARARVLFHFEGNCALWALLWNKCQISRWCCTVVCLGISHKSQSRAYMHFVSFACIRSSIKLNWRIYCI